MGSDRIRSRRPIALHRDLVEDLDLRDDIGCHHAIDLTTLPSTRSAVPLVAEACVEQT